MADQEGNGPPVEEGDPFSDDLEVPVPEATQPEEAPAEPEPTEPPAEPEAAEPEQPAAQPEQPAAEAEEPPPILGKYKSQEELERAHQELDRWSTQQAMRAAEAERQLAEWRDELERLKSQEEQRLAQQQPLEDLDLQDPQVVQQLIAQEAQRVAQAQIQQFQAQQAQEQQNLAAQQWQRDLAEFRASHPDANDWAASIKMVFDDYGDSLPVSKDSLEVAYQLATQPQVKQVIDRFQMEPDIEAVSQATEILADPNLLAYVSAHPDSVFADKDGWEQVKRYAGVPVGAKAPDPEAEKAKLHAQERGGTGAPAQAAPGPRDDAWAEIGGDLWEKERKETAQLFSK